MSDHTKQEKSVSIEITFIIFLIFIGFFFQNLAFNELKQAMQQFFRLMLGYHLTRSPSLGAIIYGVLPYS